MGNKGMAISGILYSILILFMALIFGVLSILSSSKMSFNKYKENLISNLTGDIDKTAGFKMYSEELLNGTDPIMDQNMIPVTIANNGEVRIADLTEEWYNYEDKMWANAVIVKEEKLNHYLNADYKTKVVLDDILAYFVWIPRYKYRISTGGTTTPSSIDIVFENSSTTKSIGNATTEYYSHPGFTFGEEELNGIWVGKFETTGTGEKPTILPNVTSLRNQNVKTQFETAKRYDSYLENKDAHMMKNSEWGAVAYLSHSTYGINGKIRLNNNSGFITGCGGSTENASSSNECQISYASNIENLPQSTTGSITGIFDMAGGSWEKVMGIYNGNVSSSGFYKFPDDIYYDLYKTTSYLTACTSGQCKGDASFETKNWNNNYYGDLDSTNSWIHRGGNFGGTAEAGIFNIYNTTGNLGNSSSFRIVLS